MKLMIHGYRIEKTCGVCPEQYDVYAGEEIVGYLRLRHGCFTAQVPSAGGILVYTAYPIGDGIFEDRERMKHLKNAIKAIQEYIANEGYNYVD